MTNEKWTAEDAVRIAHTLPHRVRLLAPVIAAQPEVCQRILERLLQTTESAEKFTVNVITGSIIVENPQGPIDHDKLLARLREYVEEEIRKQPPTDPGPTKIGQSIGRAFAALNADVRGGLRHRADLATLLPVFLATLALGQIFTTGRLPAPAWFNFCWWSFRAFLTFHKNAGAKETDTATNVHEPSTSRTASEGASEKSTSPSTRHSSSPE